MENNPQLYKPGDTIKIKFSGDGAKISRTSNFVLLSFGILTKEANVLSGPGILHTHYIYYVVKIPGKHAHR